VPTRGRHRAVVALARVWLSKPRRAAIKLVAAGQLPTREAVESVTRELIAAKSQAAAQRRAGAEAFVAARGPDAAWPDTSSTPCWPTIAASTSWHNPTSAITPPHTSSPPSPALPVSDVDPGWGSAQPPALLFLGVPRTPTGTA
jgi:hypothetical protein